MYELHFLVYQEQHKDRLREIQRQHLLRAFSQDTNAKMYRQAVGWLGNQLVNWGLRLQNYGDIRRYTDKRCQDSSFTMSMIQHR
jgi:hypothetical protein